MLGDANKQMIGQAREQNRPVWSRRFLIGVAALLLMVGGSTAQAQNAESPEAKIARAKYSITQAKGKKSVAVVGKVVATASVEPGFDSKFGVVLEDYENPPKRVVVYAKSVDTPPTDKMIFVRGELIERNVTGNGNNKYPLFLAEGWKSGLPQEEGSGTMVAGLAQNKVLLIALGALLIGGATLFLGLLQRGGKKKPTMTGQTEFDPLSADRTHMADEFSPSVSVEAPMYGGQGSHKPGTGGGLGGGGGLGRSPSGLGNSGLPLAPDSDGRSRGGTGNAFGGSGNAFGGGFGNAPSEGHGETIFDEKDVFANPEGSDTVFDRGETIAALPAHFEVVKGTKETPGATKPLLSAGGRLTFDIARAANGQEMIANFIPIKSDMVSRNSENQGKVIYDSSRAAYILRNLADPAQRKNPIKVGGVPMQPGEERPLVDGDTIQVGDVVLKFCKDA